MNATEWSEVAMAELLPTGTVTLLLADVEGSTQLWETRPDAMTSAVARMNQTASNLVAEHNGVRPVEQGEGDSFVAAFARASDAVACALQLQRKDLAPIKLRIGVHTGDVQLRDEGNYAGTTINKTARIRDLAHGGQTVISAATEEMVEDHLPDDAWLTDLGRHGLRDLPRPVRVSQLCHPDVRNEFPPLRTTNVVAAHNLPAQLTRFVGRITQIREISSSLAAERLVTLTGAGGAGKTRLAIEVARQIGSQFSDGICYTDLAPITHPDLVPLTVARALGLPDQPGRSITETLLRAIRDRQLLLIFDNCEHLLQASAELVNDVLASCSRVTILATSREPLMVAGEVNWQVPSLSLTDEAVELFTDRARRARPDFAVTDANSDTVADICRRLDGMPLAIELAAARVRALSLNEIVDSLHDRFRLLTGGGRTAVRRQQTLRASVDWSHALLTEHERILFRRLAVFMGGFDLDAAQAVAGATAVERFQVLDQLSLLVDKSLVVAENLDGRTRYRLLETVRQYALEKLGESGEADEVRGRHRDHFSEMADQLDASTTGGYEHRVTQAVNEVDNLRAAFTWSLETGDFAKALGLASALQPLWLLRGRVSEGIAWLDAAGAAGESVEPAIWARAIADKAILSSWVDVADMVEPTMQALAVARDVNDPALLCRVLTACACITAHDAGFARPYFAEAADLARDLGDSWRLCQILGRQAYGAMIEGNIETAQSLAQEGHDLATALGDDFNARQCLMYLAWASMGRGEVVTAMAQFRDMVQQATAAHDVVSKVAGLICLGYAQAWHGDADEARKTAAETLDACAELGFLVQNGYLVVILAELATGNAAAALQAGEVALRSATNSAIEKANLIWVAKAALASGDTDRARQWADEAASETRGMFLCLVLAERARIHVAEGHRELAAADVYDGLAIAAPMGAYLCVPDYLECLAELVHADSSRHAARLLGAAHAMRERLELPLFKVYEGYHGSVVASLRNILSDSDFDAAWAEGAALSTTEAIAYALRGHGERKRPATGWASLTPTELDVVRLVAEGISNKDIATRLFVSPRTVQSHLRHVYNKLSVTSRVQLAQEAERQLSATK